MPDSDRRRFFAVLHTGPVTTATLALRASILKDVRDDTTHFLRSMHRFYEFFAGGGMARAGIGTGWKCLFANDFDLKKSRTYEAHWGEGVLKTADVRNLATSDLPGHADLAWASFPCQDLSLAGSGAGLNGDRSGTFWPFWALMRGLAEQRRAPPVIVLENVCGTLTSHDGKDFRAICAAFREAQYRIGAVVIDAALFIPQSRPRLFIVGVEKTITLPPELLTGDPSPEWHPGTLQRVHENLPKADQESWVWWRLPEPPARKMRFADLRTAIRSSEPRSACAIRRLTRFLGPPRGRDALRS